MHKLSPLSLLLASIVIIIPLWLISDPPSLPLIRRPTENSPLYPVNILYLDILFDSESSRLALWFVTGLLTPPSPLDMEFNGFFPYFTDFFRIFTNNPSFPCPEEFYPELSLINPVQR